MTSTHPTRRATGLVPAIALLLAAALTVALLLAAPVPAEAASPTFSSITPTEGSAGGGTTVTIIGSNFEPGVAVYFQSVPAARVTRVSSTEIVAVTPPGSQGAANVRIVNPGLHAVDATAVYFYTAPAPSLAIASVQPAEGSAAGGTLVTVTGSGFTSATNVLFGGAPATSVTWLGASSLWARTPPGSPGAVPVSAVNSDGTTATLNAGYTYTGSGAFSLSSVSPNVGPSSGGTTVTITGNGFVAGSMVTFGSAVASSPTVVSGTQIVVATPPNPAGVTSVTVRTPAGESATLSVGFTYSASAGGGPGSGAAPTISSPLPPQGFGLFVFSGGSNAQLVAAAGCPGSSAAFWVTDGSGGFITYVPGTSIAAVNAAWNARFPLGLPANTPLIGKCS